MNRDALNYLSKEELVEIILDLNQKYSLETKEIMPLYVDYRSLLEATSDIIFVLDHEGNLMYRNSAWKTLFPSHTDMEVGRKYITYLPEIEKERARFVFESVMQDGKSFENEMMKTFDESGKIFYFISSFSPIKTEDSKVRGVVGIMRNITDRYLMEKKLKDNSRILEEKVKELIRQSEEISNLRDLNDDIIDNAPIGIFMMDPSGIMLSENSALKEIMGRKPTESVVGVNLLHTQGFKDAGFVELFERGVREKKKLKVSNAAYRPILGSHEIIINVTLSPIIDKKGHVEKVIIMVEDNTEQYRTNQRINRAERLSSLGLLASGVASELRNYINQMVMDLNFVDNNVEENSVGKEYVDNLKRELDRIKNISEQLLSLSSIDDSEKDICDLNKVVHSHQLVTMINRLEKDGFTVKIDLYSMPLNVKATINQLEQILLQFVENAEEAMPEKGVITIATEMFESPEVKYAIIDVRDAGIGIPEENIKKIFQPFFTTKGKNATGLGLMIVINVIDNLGGTIGVKSAPGEGTSIRVAIPLAD